MFLMAIGLLFGFALARPGEHTREVLAEIGYDGAKIEGLVKQGAVVG
jgi:crotonobetainyl-CoA:carnitine CoA-transferase CaiB-like acyl-CoA transferase